MGTLWPSVEAASIRHAGGDQAGSGAFSEFFFAKGFVGGFASGCRPSRQAAEQ